MPRQSLPTPVRLEQPGPYETPIVEAFLGLMAFRGELPTRVCLVLQGGIELQIPVPPEVQEKLRKALNDQAADQES